MRFLTHFFFVVVVVVVDDDDDDGRKREKWKMKTQTKNEYILSSKTYYH